MDRLLAKDAVLDTVYKLAYSIDSLDRKSIVALFNPDQAFTFDISAILGVPARDMMPEGYWQLCLSGLGGFTSTHHLLGCPIVTFATDTAAHVKVYIAAFHAIENESGAVAESATARVSWNMDLELSEGGWLIRKIVIFKSSIDHPEIMRKGHQRVEEGLGRKGEE
ncbi:hypothetical protein LTR53_000771 [Teratosphaeriaceae sp. CCFEE 6253]|nr:hypothetical protein LTR53_000771 [Teratosphaeriaceae sp. CCFEE 6253]